MKYEFPSAVTFPLRISSKVIAAEQVIFWDESPKYDVFAKPK